jgi:hypothetical protein
MVRDMVQNPARASGMRGTLRDLYRPSPVRARPVNWLTLGGRRDFHGN